MERTVIIDVILLKSHTQNHHNTKLAYQEKFEEREAWHKIVVKVLSWKDGLKLGGNTKFTDKITIQEWNTYSQALVKTNVVHGREKTLKKLAEIKKIIAHHGGFEN